MKKIMRVFLILMIVISLLSALAVACGAVWLLRYKDSRVDEMLLQADYTEGETQFYYYDFSDRADRVGEASLIEGAYLDNGIKYRYTSYSEMPKHLINAFLAIEDKRFYDHRGIDIKRTAGAVFNYLFGTGSFGGSTITQQLVKNLTGEDQFSVERKLKEAFAAIDLEERLDKTEILELYLNVINLAGGCRGVGAAAEYYFSKAPAELSLCEAAAIAAITNNPTRYDPIKHPESNKKRRNLILRCMEEQGYITKEAYEKAANEPITLSPAAQKQAVNSWYIDMVTEDVLTDLSRQYGISQAAASLLLYRGGYKIYTAMDPQIQEIVENYYADPYNFPIDEEGELPQSSMIVIDPYTGDILGVAGAIGEKKGNRIQSYATDTRRPPGSVIKPLSVYGPALENGLIQWNSCYEDAPIEGMEQNGRPWPANVNRVYNGKVDIHYAVEHSLNTVAVRVLEELGHEKSLAFLRENLRFKSWDAVADSGAAALALGQPSRGVTLRELTAAYSIFEEGIMSKPRSYFKVTDKEGSIILDNRPEEKAVLSRENAAIMTKLLETVIETGTARGTISLDNKIDVAGKTGTTSENRDRYFVGYTPSLLAGVWFGYAYPKDLSYFGGNLSVTFWDEVMTEIYEKTDYGKEAKHFSVPPNVIKLSYPAESEEDEGPLQEGWFTAAHKP